MSRQYLDDREKKQAKAMLDVTPYVFVYGTLKKSHGNNRILSDSEFIGEDSTDEGWLLGQGGIPYAFPPAVVPEEYKSLLRPIRGEVWEVDSKITAHMLDCLEGYHENPKNAHYWRRVVRTKELKLDAWIYTQENFMRAHRLDACNLTDKGEWTWSRN